MILGQPLADVGEGAIQVKRLGEKRVHPALSPRELDCIDDYVDEAEGVLEKRPDIGVLKALGASRAMVLQIFLCEGLLIGGLGTGLGVVLGGGLIALLKRYPFVRLPGDVYFIERLPVRPEVGDFAAVALAAFVLCLTAALYPAWRASLLEPVEAIRKQG